MCRVGDVPDLTADPALAEKELGFKAPRNLEEMCRDQWNWQSKNPAGQSRHLIFPHFRQYVDSTCALLICRPSLLQVTSRSELHVQSASSLTPWALLSSSSIL